MNIFQIIVIELRLYLYVLKKKTLHVHVKCAVQPDIHFDSFAISEAVSVRLSCSLEGSWHITILTSSLTPTGSDSGGCWWLWESTVVKVLQIMT